jgi:hypothetical protein
MKAITISQPFASLIASGEKWVENRHWSTNYRGPLAIHAGKGLQYLTKGELAEYDTSKVIAIAQLQTCLQITEIRDMGRSALKGAIVAGSSVTWSQLNDHQHTEGPYCWVLGDIRRIEPIAATGKQGLWEWIQPEVLKVK